MKNKFLQIAVSAAILMNACLWAPSCSSVKHKDENQEEEREAKRRMRKKKQVPNKQLSSWFWGQKHTQTQLTLPQKYQCLGAVPGTQKNSLLITSMAELKI
ncbi:MAG: hypothetical protein IPP43_15250 [Chitinophagaceae bacterium]|nr:hypothetical protein [Chitinophagaceae bacterium]